MLDKVMDHSLYLISNLFRIYIVFKFIKIFFNRQHVNKFLECIFFSLYYLVNSGISIWLDSPIINLCSNVVLFFLLTYQYEGKLSTRLISTALIYVVNMLLDGLAYFCILPLKFTFNVYVETSIFSNLLLFLFVLALERVFRTEHTYKISAVHWITIFLVPVCSMLIAATLILSGAASFAEIGSVSCLLIINIMIFYLYDEMIKFYGEKYEKELLRQQNNAYINQFEIIQSSQNNIRRLQHDLKNHIFKIRDLANQEKKEELLAYLDSELEFIAVAKEYVHSDNDDINSILNYKIQEAKKSGASVQVCVKAPKKLGIQTFHLNVILGNLMDNAIQALNDSEQKQLNIDLELERGIMYITVENTYSGNVIWKNKRLQTTKKDKFNHGLGISNVERIVEKYNGTMEIEYDKEKFCVSVLLYNPIITKNTDAANESL